MPTLNEIAEKVKEVLAAELKVGQEELQPDKRIGEDLGADSLQRVELVMRLEETFGIKIPDDEAMNLVTVQNAIDYLQAHLNNESQGQDGSTKKP